VPLQLLNFLVTHKFNSFNLKLLHFYKSLFQYWSSNFNAQIVYTYAYLVYLVTSHKSRYQMILNEELCAVSNTAAVSWLAIIIVSTRQSLNCLRLWQTLQQWSVEIALQSNCDIQWSAISFFNAKLTVFTNRFTICPASEADAGAETTSLGSRKSVGYPYWEVSVARSAFHHPA